MDLTAATRSRGVALALGCLALVLIALSWTLSGSRKPTEPPIAGTVTPTPTATPKHPSGSPTPIRHRLAGVAGGNVQYVVIEDPNGVSNLYQLGEEVSGLGSISRIEEDAATINGPSGSIRLRVLPASTATVTATVRSPQATPTGPLTQSSLPRQPTRTASASSP